MLRTPVNDDDIFTLHAIWLTAQGFVPYRDFFDNHLPGLMILASPIVGLVERGSGLILGGRVLIAILFGATIVLAGRMLKASGVQALLLGLLSLPAAFHMIRTEYVAAVFLFLHLWLLVRGHKEAPSSRDAFGAAVALALACTMSLRSTPFLLLQPALMLVLWLRRGIAPQVTPYLLGLVAGIAPTAIFLTWHRLWAQAWYWSFNFVSAEKVAHWRLNPPPEGPFILYVPAVACVALLCADRALTFRTRFVVALAWFAAAVFWLVNPLPAAFTGTPLVLLTAAVVSRLPFTLGNVLGRGRQAAHALPWRRAAAVAVALLAILVVIRQRAYNLSFRRDAQATQLELIDWLQSAAAGERVVLIAPHHPIVVPDATDLQNAWYYGYWLQLDPVKRRLADFPTRVVRYEPAVLAADPWRLNLLDWLVQQGVVTETEMEVVRRLIVRRYVEVEFPELRALPYGHVFWVRRDCLRIGDMPRPHLLRAPQLGGALSGLSALQDRDRFPR
jgi:hypothetical protein